MVGDGYPLDVNMGCFVPQQLLGGSCSTYSPVRPSWFAPELTHDPVLDVSDHLNLSFPDGTL